MRSTLSCWYSMAGLTTLVNSGLLLDSDGAIPRPRPRTSLQDRAKRSTRLFGFASTSGSEKSPTTLADSSLRSRNSNSTLGNPRDAPSTMKAKEVDAAPKAMLREKEEMVKDGNLMDKIGRADCSGWMKKKGEKYNTWKMRFFVLKGVYLYYLKSEAVRLPLSLPVLSLPSPSRFLLIFFDRVGTKSQGRHRPHRLPHPLRRQHPPRRVRL